MKRKNIYVAISTLAHVYAFVFILLMLISLGDEAPIFFLPQAFSWTILWIIWLVCDHNPHTRRTRHTKTRAYARQFSSMFVTLQKACYFSWAIYEWTIAKGAMEGDSFIKVPAVFYGLLVSTTFVMFLISSVTFLIVSYYHDDQ